MANTRDLIGEQETLDGLINQTLTSLEEDGIDVLADYALTRNKTLTNINFPNVSRCGSNAFDQCTNLLFANLPAATTFSGYCFYGCSKLTTPIISAAVQVGEYTFGSCGALTGLEMPVTVSNVAGYCFNGCTHMAWLKLPKTSMVTLDAVNALTNTQIQFGYGAIYVPSNLVATYKADSKWGQFIIASLDDYPLTDFSTIKDSWSEILAAEQDGTYSTKYAIGDTKKEVINGNDVYMQIVAFDTDTLTGGGTAKITWVAKNISEKHCMNTSRSNSGGWAQSEMRSWLRNTVYTGLDSELKTAIKEVEKTYYINSTSTAATVSDTLWIPSWREICMPASQTDAKESSGPRYSIAFTDSDSRKKYNLAVGEMGKWWIRSAHRVASTPFSAVSNAGTSAYDDANVQNGVVFGFCT